jgi:hypothetical protein
VQAMEQEVLLEGLLLAQSYFFVVLSAFGIIKRELLLMLED